MKIGIAQTKSIPGDIQGDIQKNISIHQRLINLAIPHQANILIFPELSITSYEPKLAEASATHPDDSRFDQLQALADSNQITIGAGVPLQTQFQTEQGISISMVIFHPHKLRQIYSKKYIHPDEEAFFISGQNTTSFLEHHPNIALAICYEISVAEHAAAAFEQNARVYIASVAKSADGVAKAAQRLSEIAQQYRMMVLMANCVGQCDDFVAAGQSAIWNHQGELLAQLDDLNEGILIVDTETEAIQKITGG
jgi:predicted amidohydrolase